MAARHGHLARLSEGVREFGRAKVSVLTRGGEFEMGTDGLAGHMLCVALRPGARVECRQEGLQEDGVVSQGEMTLVSAGKPVRWRARAPLEPLTLNVVLDPDAVAEAAGREVVDLRPTTRFHDPALARLVGAIATEAFDSQGRGGLFGDALTVALAVRLAERHTVQGVREVSLRRGRTEVRQAVELMESDLRADHRLETLARAVCLSSYHLARVFRAEMGETPHGYLMRLRLERARRLLADGTRSAFEVALETGFYDGAHLARHYRRAFGRSPRDRPEDGRLRPHRPKDEPLRIDPQ